MLLEKWSFQGKHNYVKIRNKLSHIMQISTEVRECHFTSGAERVCTFELHRVQLISLSFSFLPVITLNYGIVTLRCM